MYLVIYYISYFSESFTDNVDEPNIFGKMNFFFAVVAKFEWNIVRNRAELLQWYSEQTVALPLVEMV